jgi:eukaryotic-like serine/threonine-protein kinase
MPEIFNHQLKRQVFKFLTNRPFWVNLLAAIALTFLIIFIILKMLGWITKHGDTLTVPVVTGKKTNDAIKVLESKGFEVLVQDSVYTDTAANGIVLKQLPEGNATVKVNRTVFITINRVIPPSFDMPKLEGQSMGAALDILERNHLKLEDTLFRPDFMKGYVLEQQYNGSKIAPGTKIKWGSKITLVIGSGIENSQQIVPDVTGQTYAEAKAFLEAEGIIVAPVPNADVKDTGRAYVFDQRPPRFNEEKAPNYIRPGMVMDLFLSVDNQAPPPTDEDKKKKDKPKKDKNE